MLNYLINVIETPMKATIATITGLVTGYIPMVVNNTANIVNNNVDTAFQHTVWTLTILVAITALVTWVQKQIYYYKKRHPKEHTSLYDTPEDDTED